MSVLGVERTLVADAFMKAVAAFDPQLDGVEP
jgi:hypothetical protein